MSHEAMNDTSEVARRALERVCSGGRQDPPVWYYSPSFVDHVNGREFHGLEGVEESVASYRRVIRNMSILVARTPRVSMDNRMPKSPSPRNTVRRDRGARCLSVSRQSQCDECDGTMDCSRHQHPGTDSISTDQSTTHRPARFVRWKSRPV